MTNAPLAPRLALLAGAGVLSVALAAPAAAAGVAPGAPAAGAPSGWLRLGHLSPDTALVDVELVAVASSDVVTFDNLGYGQVADYRSVPVGFYTVNVRMDGGAQAAPVVTARLQVQEGGAQTIAVTGREGAVQATTVADDLTPPPPGQTRVRLLQAASTAPEVDVLAVGGPTIAEDVAFGTATGYANVPAGPWSLQLTPTGGSATATTADVVLSPGSVQTVLALEQGDGITARAIVDAQGVAQMPAGGVQTGGGGAYAASPGASGLGGRVVGDGLSVQPLGVLALGVAAMGALALRQAAVRRGALGLSRATAGRGDVTGGTVTAADRPR